MGTDTPIYDALTTFRCMAHGDYAWQHTYDDCTRVSTRCQCGTFAETGMHWDTCPGRGRFVDQEAAR